MTGTIETPRKAPSPRAYARLAKLSFFDYYLATLVVWTMLEPDLRRDPRVLVTLVVVTLGWIGVCGASVAFDDVTGFRDGSDRVNYDPDQRQLRNLERKPLLNGDLTVRQALRCGYALLAAGAVALAVTFLVAPHRPGWALWLTPLMVAIAVQYSYGLRLSYHGGQELALFIPTALVVFIPYGLTHGDVTGMVVLETYLAGLWSLLVSVYSNINDRAGDLAVGRRNLATVLSPRACRTVIVLLSLTEPAAVLWACAAHAVPWWFLVLLVPLLVTRGRQVVAGVVRGELLVARKLGGRAHRLGVVLLLAANLLAVR